MAIDGIVGLGFEQLAVKTKPLMDSLVQENLGEDICKNPNEYSENALIYYYEPVFPWNFKTR